MGTGRIFMALHWNRVSSAPGSEAEGSPLGHLLSETSDPAAAVTSLARCSGAGRKGQRSPRGLAGLGYKGSLCGHQAWLHPEMSNGIRNSVKPGALEAPSPPPQQRHSCASTLGPGLLFPARAGSKQQAVLARGL